MASIVLYGVYSILGLALTLTTLFFARNIYLRNKKEKLQIDRSTLQYITKLMPWVHAQIRRSVEVNVNSLIDGNKDNINQTKLVTSDQYMQIIKNIQTHFYGTLPKCLSDTIFKYITLKQINVLIMNAFLQYNDGFIRVREDENIGEEV